MEPCSPGSPGFSSIAHVQGNGADTAEKDVKFSRGLARGGSTLGRQDRRLVEAPVLQSEPAKNLSASRSAKRTQSSVDGKEAQQERLQEEFERLAGHGFAVLTVHSIESMMRRQHVTMHIHEVEELVAHLNQIFERGRDAEGGHDGIDFKQFSALMLATSVDLEAKCGADVATKIINFKEMIFYEEAHALVVDNMRLAREELNENVRKRDRMLSYMDGVINVIVLVNAITIGLSTDYEWDGWIVVEVCFATVFVMELLMKLFVHGVVEYFFGWDWRWHNFDFLLVIVAVVDVVINLSETNAELPGLSVARVLRLLRFARLVRVARRFKELSLMVSGLIGGIRTLFWAMVMFFVMVYVLAVLLTQTVGKDTEDPIPNWASFEKVPISMFTVFNCLTGDCSGADGISIVVQLANSEHAVFILGYSFIIFITIFGLFNLVAAIFVENTMTAAKFNDEKIAMVKRKKQQHLAQKLEMLLGKFNERQNEMRQKEEVTTNPSNILSGAYGAVHGAVLDMVGAKEEGPRISHKDMSVDITKEQFHELIEDPGVQNLFDELDLSVTDREDLFDVLDGDGSGAISAQELVKGVLKVRGEAKKSDSVATQLAVRAVQISLKDYMEESREYMDHHDQAEVTMRADITKIMENQSELSEKLNQMQQQMAMISEKLGVAPMATGQLVSPRRQARLSM